MKSDDGNITPTLWSVAVVGAVLTLGSPLLFGVQGVVSAGIGSALAVANLWAIGRMVRGFLGAGRKMTWGPFGFLKLSLLFVLLGLVVRRGYAEVLPLAFGYLAMPIGIVLSQLRSSSPARGEN